MSRVDGLLLDLDGVLVVSWEQIDGAVGAIERLRRDRIPFRLITNTTTHSRHGLAERLVAGRALQLGEDDLIGCRVEYPVLALLPHLRLRVAGMS